MPEIDWKRQLIDTLAKESAIASWDAHGEFWNSADMWDWIINFHAENPDDIWNQIRTLRYDTLPAPAQFGHDYARHSRNILNGNPFYEVTRDLPKA